MKARLGVNIDHVATLRQARGEDYPSIANAAQTVLNAGADQITIHLREDRRHIQDADVRVVREITKSHSRLFNFEMGCYHEMIDTAIEVKPDWICLVPEKREERTTEGGLDITTPAAKLKVLETCELLKSKIDNVKISLFVEANLETEKSVVDFSNKKLIDAVEIHTGDFARALHYNQDFQDHLKRYQDSKSYYEQLGIGHHAGHGLTDQSLKTLAERALFIEYNVGHWIISQSIIDGLENVVKNCLSIIR